MRPPTNAPTTPTTMSRMQPIPRPRTIRLAIAPAIRPTMIHEIQPPGCRLTASAVIAAPSVPPGYLTSVITSRSRCRLRWKWPPSTRTAPIAVSWWRWSVTVSRRMPSMSASIWWVRRGLSTTQPSTSSPSVWPSASSWRARRRLGSWSAIASRWSSRLWSRSCMRRSRLSATRGSDSRTFSSRESGTLTTVESCSASVKCPSCARSVRMSSNPPGSISSRSSSRPSGVSWYVRSRPRSTSRSSLSAPSVVSRPPRRTGWGRSVASSRRSASWSAPWKSGCSNSSTASMGTNIRSGTESAGPVLPGTSGDVHQRLALGPVDRDVGTVDEARARRGQERHERGDLLRLADAVERDRGQRQVVGAVLIDLLVAGERLLEPVPAVGVHGPRVDRVDPDPVRAVLLGDRRREVDVGRVRRPRRHLPVARLQPVVADDEHDRTGPPLAHVGDDGPHRADVPHELEVQAGQPLLLGQVLQQPARGAAGARDEDVDPAPALERCRDAALDVLGPAHVPGERQDRSSGLGGDLARRVLQRGGRAGGDDDVGALRCQVARHLASDALA